MYLTTDRMGLFFFFKGESGDLRPHVLYYDADVCLGQLFCSGRSQLDMKLVPAKSMQLIKQNAKQRMTFSDCCDQIAHMGIEAADLHLGVAPRPS